MTETTEVPDDPEVVALLAELDTLAAARRQASDEHGQTLKSLHDVVVRLNDKKVSKTLIAERVGVTRGMIYRWLGG